MCARLIHGRPGGSEIDAYCVCSAARERRDAPVAGWERRRGRSEQAGSCRWSFAIWVRNIIDGVESMTGAGGRRGGA
jgi:hypothetical protein